MGKGKGKSKNKNSSKNTKNLLEYADEVQEGEIVSEESHSENEVQLPDAAKNDTNNIQETHQSAVKTTVTDTAVMEKNGSPKNGSLKNHTAKHHDAATNNGERDAGNIHKTDQAPAKTRTTTTKNHVKIQSNTEAVGTTTATTTDAATEISTDSSNSKHTARPADTNEKRDENTERIVKVPKHPELTQQQLHSEWRPKRSKLDIGNLTTDTTEEDIKELFGINNTTLLRENSTVQLHFNTKSKFKGYAILDTFTHVAEELLPLNGFEFKSRKLVIEIARNIDHKSNTDKATYPYDRRGLQRGRGNQDNLATSSRRRNNAIRPAPAASSRQEETNTIGFWEQCSEEVGERDRKKQDNKTMA